ncbi:MAG: hypothetical protein GEV03_04910 [Streptosporangiales bacterium]|nr:hypothetical protein [Streptosporangiales bacterium]
MGRRADRVRAICRHAMVPVTTMASVTAAVVAREFLTDWPHIPRSAFLPVFLGGLTLPTLALVLVAASQRSAAFRAIPWWAVVLGVELVLVAVAIPMSALSFATGLLPGFLGSIVLPIVLPEVRASRAEHARAAAERRIDASLGKARELLHAGDASKRIDALAEIERLAQTHQRLRGPAVDAICGYLRTLGDVGSEPERRARRAAQRILAGQLRRSGTRLDLTGACLEDLDLSGCRVTGVLTGATFGGDARFVGTKFGPGTTFGKAVFLGHARFDDASFSGDSYRGDVFRGVDFKEATFHGDAVFSGAYFHGYAGFARTVFRGVAVFDGATFYGLTVFTGTSGRINLRGATASQSWATRGSRWPWGWRTKPGRGTLGAYQDHLTTD